MALVKQWHNTTAGVNSSGETPTVVLYGLDMNVDAVRADPDLPQIGDPHPVYGAFTVATNINIVPTPGGATAVVSYGNPNFLREPSANDLAVDYSSLSVTYETVDVDVPVIELRTGSTGEGDTYTEFQAWAIVDQRKPVRVTRTVLRFSATLQWSIPSTMDSVLALSSAVQAQTGKLHKFGEKYYLFRPETIAQETSRWRVVYQWIDDPGIKNTLPYVSQPGPNWIFNKSRAYPIDDTDTYTIPPWHSLDLEYHESDPTQTPYVGFSPIAIQDDTGYLSLPGIA